MSRLLNFYLLDEDVRIGHDILARLRQRRLDVCLCTKDIFLIKFFGRFSGL